MRDLPVRSALVAVALVSALLLGYVVGRTNVAGTPKTASSTAIPAHQHGPSATGGDPANGLSVSAAGYTLYAETTTIQPDTAATLTFWIIGPGRKPVTAFATVHEQPLHLIVVRRDLTGYQHLHPTMDATGTWTVPLRLSRPGIYRAYADFSVTAADGNTTSVVLGTDLTAPGPYGPEPLPAAAREASTGPFTLTMNGTPRAGGIEAVYFRISTAGAPATRNVQRYLGSYAHLVTVREGDLALSHAHGDELTENGIRCWLATPGPGRYRFFVDFKQADTVHTAAYTQVVS
jgi:hypothetical protein